MTVFEKILPFLVGALIALTAVLAVLCVRVERRLADRKNINLSNYKEKNSLFYILNDIPVAVISGAAAVMALVLGILCLVNPVIRIYAAVLAALLAVDAIVFYLSFTRKRTERDIRAFDLYYVQVENVLTRKERTMADIRVCQRRVDELRERLLHTVDELNRNLADSISGEFLLELFRPVDATIASYMQEIEQFSLEVEQNFDLAMQEFLANDTVPEFQMVPLRTFDEGEVDDLLASIKTACAERITNVVVEQVDTGAIKSARSLGNIMMLFHRLGVRSDAETMLRFVRSAAVFEDRGALATLLYANKQIPASMVCEIFIPENWEWIVVPEVAVAYNRRELGAILSALLAADRKTMCYQVLSRFSAYQSDLLDAALAEASEENSAVRLARAYRLILSHTYAVGNSGNLHENLAYTLYDRRRGIGMSEDDQRRIEQIVKEQSFWQSREEITELYERASRKGAPLVASATRLLLHYIIAAPTDFLDPVKLCSLLAEYRETLSFGEIMTMRALLAAWLLKNTDSDEVADAVLHELSAMPIAADLRNVPERGEKEAFAAQIFAHLSQNGGERMRSLIYRSESKRALLDRILAF